jgi:CBS domain-containing protein
MSDHVHGIEWPNVPPVRLFVAKCSAKVAQGVQHWHATCTAKLTRELAGRFFDRRRMEDKRAMGITAADLMTTNLITLTPEMTLIEMDTVLVKRGVSGAPVVEFKRLVGVASQADVVRTLWQGQHEASQLAPYYSSPFPVPISALEYIAKDSRRIGDQLVEHHVRDIMTKDPLVAHPEDPIEEIADRMVRDQIHRIPVTEAGSGDLVGIVTTLDLVNAITTYGLVSVS